MTPLSDIVDLAGPWLWSGFVILLRVGPIMALAPVFGEQAVPVRLRLALAMAASVILMTLPVGGHDRPATAAALLALAGAEVLTGLLFGLALRLLVLALLSAGSIIAQSISLAQIAGGGATPEPAPAVGHLLLFAGLASAASTGLPVKLVAYLATSYALLPVGSLPAAETVITAGLAVVSRSFALAVSLALPFVIVTLLYNLMLGVINRAMPQMMVTLVGAPLLVGTSLALLALLLPLLLDLWQQALDRQLSMPFSP